MSTRHPQLTVIPHESGIALLSDSFSAMHVAFDLFTDPNTPREPGSDHPYYGWRAIGIQRFLHEPPQGEESLYDQIRPVVAHIANKPVLAHEPRSDRPDLVTMERVGEIEGVGIWRHTPRFEPDDPLAKFDSRAYIAIVDRQIALMALHQEDLEEAVRRAKQPSPTHPPALAAIASIVPEESETYVLRTCRDPEKPELLHPKNVVPFLGTRLQLDSDAFGIMYFPSDKTAYRLVVSPEAAATDLPTIEGYIKQLMTKVPPEMDLAKAITLSSVTDGPTPHLKVNFDLDQFKDKPGAGMGLVMGMTHIYLEVFSAAPLDRQPEAPEAIEPK